MAVAWVVLAAASAPSVLSAQVVHYSYDAQGQVTATARPNNTLAYQYDAAGNRTQLTVTPAGSSLAAANAISAGGNSAGGNIAPAAVPDAVTVLAGQTIVIPALANDSDPDGDSLTITSVGSDRSASFAVTENGKQVRFEAPANAGYSTTMVLTYTISDGHGGTAVSTIRVTVQAA